MDIGYYRAKRIINDSRDGLKSVFALADCKGIENEEAYRLLENIIEKLGETAREIEYLENPIKEGVLAEGSNKKFYIAFDDGSRGYDLSSGVAVELLCNEGWENGKIELRDGQYYFHGKEDISLLSRNIKIRKRQ